VTNDYSQLTFNLLGQHRSRSFSGTTSEKLKITRRLEIPRFGR
jgi:hypothetical protein